MKKSFIKITSLLFPNQIATFAYRQLANPQVKKLRPREWLSLNKAQKEIFKFHSFDIQLYTWHGGNEKVLLIHGWEGQAGNFSDIIEQLIEQNYTVYAFDGPSHGASSKGKTSLFEFTDLVGVLIKKFKVTKLISHSFGSVATIFALFKNQNITINKYILLTTPDKFSERINDVTKKIGVTENVKYKLIRRIEKETGYNVNTLNASDYVKSINVAQALIIHDTNDTVLPIAYARNVHKNWKNCTFLEVQGTGHFKILRTKLVIDATLSFLKG